MYCTHCGKEIADDQQVCPYCGQKTIAYKEENSSNSAGKNNGFNQSNPNNGYNNFNGNGGYNHNQNNQSGGYGGNGYNNGNGNYNNGYGYNQNGNPNYNQNFRPQNFDAPNAGFAVLSFFFPLVGLILYLVWNDQYPLKAKSCGKGALIGVITEVALVLLSVIFVSCIMCNVNIGGGGIYY